MEGLFLWPGVVSASQSFMPDSVASLLVGDTQPNWRLQTKRRIPSQPSVLNEGGFREWTNVPPVGMHDPHTADQMRSGRAVFPNYKPTPPPGNPEAGGSPVDSVLVLITPSHWLTSPFPGQ